MVRLGYSGLHGAFLLCLALPVGPQTITPDATIGTAVTLIGDTYAITAGRPAGRNLFHSFERFSLEGGTVADFQNTLGGNVENIISRVTGGNESLIDGQIRSSIANANVFLINPSGITFTENASLDVSGAFLASTADFIGFGHGEPVFSASEPNGGEFSEASPQAFGFTRDSPAPIDFLGPTIEVPSGATLSVAGGHLTIAAADLLAPGGRIDITSVASTGDVQIPNALTDAPGTKFFSQLGSVELSDDAVLDAGGVGGGTIYIRAGRLVAADAHVFASIKADASSATIGAGIDIEVREDVLLDNATQVGSNVFDGVSQNSGGVRIRAGVVDIGAGSVIESNGFLGSGGSSGAIEIAADDVVIRDGAAIRAIAFASGDSGDTFIAADRLEVRDGGFVFSLTQGTGNAGDIEIDSGRVSVSTTSQFTAITSRTSGAGSAGLVKVVTSDLQVGTGAEISSLTFGAGAGNDVSIVPDNGRLDLHVSGGGIFANSLAAGPGGNLNIASVDAPGSTVRIDSRGSVHARGVSSGDAGMLSIHADLVEVVDGGFLNTSSFGFFGFGQARAGDIEITAEQVVISGFESAADPILSDATGVVSAATQGSGDVRITAADTLTLTNRARINASTFGAGTGGIVALDVGRLELLEGGNILSNTFSSGDGGAIDVTADQVVISGVHPQPFFDSFSGLQLLAFSAISVQSQSLGKGGAIRIDTGTLEVRDGGRISSETFAAGNGGAIDITAHSTVVAGVSPIHEAFQLEQGADPVEARTNASAAIIANASPVLNATTGPGGAIGIISRSLDLHDNGLILSGTSSNGAGGSIDIRSEDAIFAGGAEVGADTQSIGNAGSITLEVSRLTLRGGALINVNTSDEGAGGDITIRARDQLRLTGTSADGRASAISTESESSQLSGGAAGSIDIAARSVLIQGGGKVSGNTSGGGQGGDILIASTDEITIAGTSALSRERSSVSTQSASSAPGAGTAGNIRITAADLTIRDGGQISTRSALADGGDVKLDVTGTVLFDAARITTSVGAGVGSGGNINIDPQFVILISSLIQANAFGGPGGNIRIVTSNFFSDELSRVEASSAQSIDGTVEIRAPDTAIGESLAVLPSAFVDVASQLAARCSARGAGVSGLFVGVGRGGLPASPDGPLSAYFAAGISVTSAGASGKGVEVPVISPAISKDRGISGDGAMGKLAPLPARRGFVPAILALECDQGSGPYS